MPAAFDMPLQEMRTYAGSNPRPKDFDQFWASALAELENTDPDVELRVADFRILNFRCLDLRFNGVGGSRVYAKVIVPEHADGKMPAVLKFHGYSGNSGDWFDLLPFAAMGNVVAALDCRGQGGISEDRAAVGGMTWTGHIVRGLLDTPENLYYRSVYLDTVQLARIIMAFEEVDEYKVSSTGHSQGG